MSRQRRGAPRPAGNPTVEEIVRYLNAHLSESITLDDLSARFFISKYYLNTVFKKYTGTTVMNYVTHKRLAAARQSIRRGTPPTDAAQECGFGDYSAFFRAYKKLYAQPPSRTAPVSYTHLDVYKRQRMGVPYTGSHNISNGHTTFSSSFFASSPGENRGYCLQRLCNRFRL